MMMMMYRPLWTWLPLHVMRPGTGCDLTYPPYLLFPGQGCSLGRHRRCSSVAVHVMGQDYSGGMPMWDLTWIRSPDSGILGEVGTAALAANTSQSAKFVKGHLPTPCTGSLRLLSKTDSRQAIRKRQAWSVYGID